ncbi:MAG TPA: FAD-linked oxidase C-terminal domain-containing protein, partial [Dehalococcoidia bacterium]|nr:FAD-linked oxidase C-terminal domain-containing protein [Dehalococcoidia bacterium]
LPKAQATLVLGIDQADIACALSYEVRQRGLSLQAAELLNARAAEAAGLSARSSYSLYLLFGGTVSAVQRSLSTARELAQEAGMSVKERPAATGSLLPDQPGLRMRINVLPTDLPELVSRLDDPTSEAVLAARPLVGSILACWPGQDADLEIIQKVRELVSRHGGTFLVEQCSPAVKAAIDVFNEAGPSFELMRRIKQQFDPTGVLSPGRFSGRL